MNEELFDIAIMVLDKCWDSLRRLNYSDMSEAQKEKLDILGINCTLYNNKAEFLRKNT